MTKYRVTIRAKTASGTKQRTFTEESDKTAEELAKQIEQDYDMHQNVHVTVREAK